jgi:hypothetical protein
MTASVLLHVNEKMAMKKRLEILAYQRLELFEKIEEQRAEVAEISREWSKPLVLVDTGLTAVRFIRNHPGWVSGGLVGLLSLRGMGIAGIVQKGWRFMYLYPSILSIGLKFLALAKRPPGEGRKTEADH